MDKVFARYGTALTLLRGEESTGFQGFLHCVTSRSRQSMERQVLPLGELPRGQYVLVAPAGLGLVPGDVIRLEESSYVLRRTETVRYQDTALCCWGLCVEEGGEDTWGSQS